MKAWKRREFIRTSAGGALLGAGGLGLFGTLPRVAAEETALGPDAVRFHPDIEPLVRLLEDSPRERLLEEVAGRIERGATYRDVLGALMLAGIRNIRPRPVGFKFHAVLVVNSAHLASVHSPEADRWLPIFWALDQFKVSQARDVQEGDWTMPAVDEAAVPSPDRAAGLFREGMDAWDEAKVDAAAAALARLGGSAEAFDLLCRYGARDYRDIGHKAIYVANSWRTLQTIGWRHAEPVIRSLAYAMLKHEGSNPAEGDALADRPGRVNQERLREIREGWRFGTQPAGAMAEMMAVLRSGDWDETSAKAVELLNRGCGPQPLWDAMFQVSAEFMMRRPNIVSLHACTTTNALHYAFKHAAGDETRRFLLLQNASFLAMFRGDAGVGGGVEILTFDPLPAAGGVDEVFAGLQADRMEGARKALGFLENGGDAREFTDAARRLIYLKGTNSHDYKYSSAVLEDYHHLSPELRHRFLAASAFWLKGADAPDSPLVARSRAALG